MKKYIFKQLDKHDAKTMFQLILERMDWFEQKGIQQWKKGDYEIIYPLSYYEKESEKGHLYGLIDQETNQLVCGAVLLEEDVRWKDQANAYYIHNLASTPYQKGTGKLFFSYLEDFAKENRKEYLRLDSLRGNETLEKYYSMLGFVEKGICVDGNYHGILREREL